MKEIICYSPTYGNQTAFVDDDDYENVNQHRWNIHAREIKKNDSKDDISKNYKFYATSKITNKDKLLTIMMHHFIFGKPNKGSVIDHINGNSLDNTRTNLRQITYQQNNQNRKSKNKYLGVSWNKTAKKYICQALGDFIGVFDDEKSAAIAYDKYIIREKGEDWRLNSIYSQEEIDKIKNEVKEEKKKRLLPEYIHPTLSNTYQVQIQKDDYKIYKTYKTLEAAITFKDQCLEEIKKIEAEKIRLHYQKSITYNQDDIAYISVKYKKQEYECLVDADKWHDLSLIGWCLADKYVVGNINGKTEQIHRYLYKRYYGDEDITDKLIDHIRGKDAVSKRLDNRMSNLRPVTSGENTYNKESNNKTGYRGVKKHHKKYLAVICHNNKTYTTKGFDTVEEAALAYNELAIKYYGDKAILNTVIQFE
jgi:hypothetical protein